MVTNWAYRWVLGHPVYRYLTFHIEGTKILLEELFRCHVFLLCLTDIKGSRRAIQIFVASFDMGSFKRDRKIILKVSEVEMEWWCQHTAPGSFACRSFCRVLKKKQIKGRFSTLPVFRSFILNFGRIYLVLTKHSHLPLFLQLS